MPYGTENEYAYPDLPDTGSLVAIVFAFQIDSIGCGCIGEEYFSRYDVKALAEGFSKVLFGNCDSFSYSGEDPFGYLTPDPFFTFQLERRESVLILSLQIHDRVDYISVTETMDYPRFESIVQELKSVARKCPVP